LWRIALGCFPTPTTALRHRRLVAFCRAVIGAPAAAISRPICSNPWVVCFSLIVGGAILLWVDQLDHNPHEHDARDFRCRCI